MKNCVVCGKKTPFWSRLDGPTGMFCGIRCYLRQQGTRQSTIDAVCSVHEGEVRERRDYRDFNIMMCALVFAITFFLVFMLDLIASY